MMIMIKEVNSGIPGIIAILNKFTGYKPKNKNNLVIKQKRKINRRK